MDSNYIENPDITFFKTDEGQPNNFKIYFNTDPGVMATIEEIKEFPAHHGIDRIPFSVVFLAQQNEVFPQRIYKVENVEGQYAEIFLVPLGQSNGFTRYQAVFS